MIPYLDIRVLRLRRKGRGRTRRGKALSKASRSCSEGRMLVAGPAFRPLHSPLPAAVERLALVGGQMRLEAPVHAPVGRQFVLALPEADRQAGQVGGAQG